MDRRDWLRLLLVTAVWLVAARLMALYGAPLLPRVIAAQLTLQSFLSLVLIVASALGLALSFWLLAKPKEDLALAKPSGSAFGMAALWAPIVLVLSAYVAFQIALPTLMAEIAAGGRAAAQRNTGEFGLALVQAHVVTTVTWAVLITPVGEELVFRGAAWSAITRLTSRLSQQARSLPPELLSEGPVVVALRAARRWLLTGGIATLLTAALFAWMHADQAGGAGLVRVVQTSCLGLALGVARHASRSIAVPIALHAVFNLLTIAKIRGWFESTNWPNSLPIATLHWQIAGACAALLALWWLVRMMRRRTDG